MEKENGRCLIVRRRGRRIRQRGERERGRRRRNRKKEKEKDTGSGERESVAKERGSSLSGRSTAGLSICWRARRNEGSPRWPTGSVYTGPLLRQHQRLSINHSRSASLRSLARLLSRLLARCCTLVLSLTAYRNASAPQMRVCLCVYVARPARLSSHFAACCGRRATLRVAASRPADLLRFLQLTPLLIEFRRRVTAESSVSIERSA